MEEDWDLYAVVRGCTTVTSSSSITTTTTTTTSTTASSVSSSGLGTCYQPSASKSFFSIFPAEKAGQVLSLSNPLETKDSIEELHELCKPFFHKSKVPSFQTSSPLSSLSYSSAPKSPKTRQKQKQPHHAGSATTPRSKRRKNQLKKVCQVQAENLSSDIWAWRKYGQKPIKGSPYPRGYYRCSSSKGCLARKQVERNKSDPTMFIVTYTGEHSHPAPIHRNSLAGSTRQKPVTPQTATAGGDSGKSPAKPVSPATSGAEEEEVAAPLSAKSEDMEDLMYDDEEENELGLSDMVVTDDFFEGLDELTGSVKAANEDCFPDPFAASIALPSWVANNAATAAGGS